MTLLLFILGVVAGVEGILVSHQPGWEYYGAFLAIVGLALIFQALGRWRRA